MKKTLSIFIMVLILGVFFCIPVNAQILYAGVARDIDQQGNIIMTTSVNQFDENSTSYHQAYLLVTVQLENISSSPTYVGYARFSLSFPDVDCHWDDFESFSNDAVLSRTVDGQYSSFKVIPNNEFSYNDGIVVPPNSSIYAIGIIGLRNSYDNAPVIQGFTVTNSIGTVATSDNYPYGQTVDYSPLLSSLNTYFGTEHTDLTNILTILGYLKVDTGNIASDVDAIQSLVDDIADNIEFTGSYTPVTSGLLSDTYDYPFDGVSGMTYRIKRLVYPEYYVSNDFELDPTSDTTIHYGDLCTRVYYLIYIRNSNNSDLRTKYYHYFSGLMPTNNTSQYSVHIHDINCNIGWIGIDNSTKISLIPSNNDSSYSYFPGKSITCISFYADYIHSESYTLNFGNMSVDIGTPALITHGYHESNVFDIMKDWFTLWRGDSNTNEDISDDSGMLKTESDAIHQQEQTYYTQNQQAIEATGLRNYNFSQSQGDGIARVSLDFTNLWNSLGTFNSVYIFSLTLGLALTILRHAPNAISRIRWKKNQ